MAEEPLEDKGEEFALQVWKDRNIKGGRVGRVNQEGNQEDIAAVLYHWQAFAEAQHYHYGYGSNLGYVMSRA